MSTNSPDASRGAGSSSPTAGPTTPVNRTRWPLYGCGALLASFLIVMAAVAVTYWWMQRPIKPVVLSAQERAVVDQKLQAMEAANTTTAATNGAAVSAPLAQNPDRPQDRLYVAGSKVLRLTEREINGLLNANTDLGDSVRLEFGRDAVNAYVAVPIPQDFPIGGGKMFRARGRFRVSLGNGGTPYAILEDITVFGLSLPKAWLGGIKGENLLGEAIAGEQNGERVLKGIKSLRIEPGALVLEVED